MSGRKTIPVHESDLVLYVPATLQAMRSAMANAYDYARSQCFAPEDVELIDEETGEIRTRTLRIVVGQDFEDKTVKQRGFLHAAVFPQIAEQVVVDGRQFAAKVWKEHYREKFLGSRWESIHMPGKKRATPRKVRVSTEDLSIKQYSEYIDRVIADAVTEFGVEFVFDQQEREAVRWKRKPRKAKVEQEEAVPA